MGIMLGTHNYVHLMKILSVRDDGRLLGKLVSRGNIMALEAMEMILKTLMKSLAPYV